jgi:hypothetical protein
VRSQRLERLQFPALGAPLISELEVMIRSHQTYMSLTNVFFKQALLSIFKQSVVKRAHARGNLGCRILVDRRSGEKHN